MLGATEKAANDSTVDIEEAAEEVLRDWMTSFQGWGLLTSLVPPASIRHINGSGTTGGLNVPNNFNDQNKICSVVIRKLIKSIYCLILSIDTCRLKRRTKRSQENLKLTNFWMKYGF